jgi:hypothetical protein
MTWTAKAELSAPSGVGCSDLVRLGGFHFLEDATTAPEAIMDDEIKSPSMIVFFSALYRSKVAVSMPPPLVSKLYSAGYFILRYCDKQMLPQK